MSGFVIYLRFLKIGNLAYNPNTPLVCFSDYLKIIPLYDIQQLFGINFLYRKWLSEEASQDDQKKMTE